MKTTERDEPPPASGGGLQPPGTVWGQLHGHVPEAGDPPGGGDGVRVTRLGPEEPHLARVAQGLAEPPPTGPAPVTAATRTPLALKHTRHRNGGCKVRRVGREARAVTRDRSKASARASDGVSH